MGYEALNKPKLPQEDQLNALAGQLSSQSAGLNSTIQGLTNPLATGTLPKPQQAQLDQASNSVIAGIKGECASMGLSGSTMEQQDIAAAQNNALALQGQLENQLFQSGLSAAGIQGRNSPARESCIRRSCRRSSGRTPACRRPSRRWRAVLRTGRR